MAGRHCRPRRAAPPRNVAAHRLAKRLKIGERALFDAVASLLAVALVAVAFMVPDHWWFVPTTPLIQWPILRATKWTLDVAGVWPARFVYFAALGGDVLLLRTLNLWLIF